MEKIKFNRILREVYTDGSERSSGMNIGKRKRSGFGHLDLLGRRSKKYGRVNFSTEW